ncbi:SAM-dependent methyltransferase [Angulomicrobium tetraedrale]|uniref:SAM-dependent methyltransferase n=1 Tax=Ancylobacter tetraedralis TaxID=217068 RepID=A0A839Z3V5_9HYPH|nr:class I SAM-dependent methyltransferase [Ancylobacter tetraedralis]MBB3770299.1 SAM-dependent methyltransferase [Ancylobacter tetraedralis]
MQQQDPLYTDASLVAFYDAENDWGEDRAFCAALARGVGSVLDLGCGTGAFLAGIDAPVRVGVDPARAMLDVARARPGGESVEWIEADARHLDLGRRFDLIVMTGHAFQVFLDAHDQRAALAALARHLAPGGRFIFDSRNPACREWEEWQPHNSRRRIDHPLHGAVEAWNAAEHAAASGIVTYQTFYHLADGREWSASSRIRFTERAELAGLMAEAGLAVERWLGDWSGSPFTETAPEIIPLGHLASRA